MSHASPPNLEGLVRLSRREGVDIRPALLRVLTDLYVQGKNHSREEEQQYVELALRLLPVVDVATRTAVAGKLAAYPGAPTPIVAYLAGDVPQVAGPVLKHPAPSREQRTGSTPAAAATEATRVLTAPSQDGNVPRAGIGAGGAATADIGESFLKAAPAERLQLLAELEANSSAEPATVAHAPDGELVRRLELAALQRNDRAFARELQLALLLPRETALRIAHDRSGEPLVVVALAVAMPVAVLQRVLLFLNPVIGESVERVFALSRLYEQLSARAALPIVASWRNVAAHRGAARYVGVHAEEAGAGAGAATDNARRAVSGGSGDGARPADVARARGLPQRTS
jgi:hypothetical protein